MLVTQAVNALGYFIIAPKNPLKLFSAQGGFQEFFRSHRRFAKFNCSENYL
jgi:hypothetical protein